ncbi:hypothetical protein Bca4012_073527 [Brassica carinata]|uniref:Uncharacterized protein n=1 Tax=Brassica carinata TaxID=52824 RepID=A0A8X7QJ01_BRACI|nr:hypothetical protein Bca52824_065819 [Brassica carinata]
MASRPSVVTNKVYRSHLSIEGEIDVLVRKVGNVDGMVLKSSLYWESIDFLAQDEVSRAIFYALPHECKLHYLKRKTHASNVKETDPTYYLED